MEIPGEELVRAATAVTIKVQRMVKRSDQRIALYLGGDG